jgi:hypothetical protein
MSSRKAALIDPPLVQAYRWMTAAYPPAFRVTFADSMTADFRDALQDAQRAHRSKDVIVLLAQVAWDLLRSVTAQWARTSVPWLTMAYAVALVCFCEGLASTFSGSPFNWLIVVLLLPPVSAITFTLWFLVPHVRHRRSSPPCLKSAA